MHPIRPNPGSLDVAARRAGQTTSRRQALRLIGAGLAGGLLSLGRAHPADAQRRCRRVGEKCKGSTDWCTAAAASTPPAPAGGRG